MSYRAQISEALKATLDGKTVAASKVFTALDRPMQAGELPALIIYTMGARRDRESYGNSLIPRIVTVHIEGATPSTPEAAQAAAEAFADQIEAAVEADPTLGRVVDWCTWQQTHTDVSSHGSTTLGVVLLEYEVRLFTNERPPEWFGVGNDGFTATPMTVSTSGLALGPGFPTPLSPPADLACGPNGCDLPAWGAEVPRP